MVDNILDALNLTEAFEIVITQEHVTKHKPDPEAYNLALSQLNATPENTVIFEDSAAGIWAGKSSGCEVVAIKHEFNGKNDMSAASKVIEAYDEMYL